MSRIGTQRNVAVEQIKVIDRFEIVTGSLQFGEIDLPCPQEVQPAEESWGRVADPGELAAERRIKSRAVVTTAQHIRATDLLNRILDLDIPVVNGKSEPLQEARRYDRAHCKRIRRFLGQVRVAACFANEKRG